MIDQMLLTAMDEEMRPDCCGERCCEDTLGEARECGGGERDERGGGERDGGGGGGRGGSRGGDRDEDAVDRGGVSVTAREGDTKKAAEVEVDEGGYSTVECANAPDEPVGLMARGGWVCDRNARPARRARAARKQPHTATVQPNLLAWSLECTQVCTQEYGRGRECWRAAVGQRRARLPQSRAPMAGGGGPKSRAGPRVALGERCARTFLAAIRIPRDDPKIGA